MTAELRTTTKKGPYLHQRFIKMRNVVYVRSYMGNATSKEKKEWP